MILDVKEGLPIRLRHLRFRRPSLEEPLPLVFKPTTFKQKMLNCFICFTTYRT